MKLLSKLTALTLSLTLAGSTLFGNPVVILKTNHGDIKIKMDPEKAPKTVENFLKYVEDGFYNDTVFHRVMPGFVVQGGGFARKPDGKHEQKKVNPPVVNEAKNGLTNKLGSISMARTRNPDSATSQFFLNIADNTGKLDPGGVDPSGYAVFGEIIEGLDVAKKIEVLPTSHRPLVARMGDQTATTEMANVPTEDAVLIEAYVEGKKKPAAAAPAPAAPAAEGEKKEEGKK